MKHDIVLSKAYPARMESIRALLLAIDERANNVEQLRDAANNLDGTTVLYGRASTAEVYGAFAELLRTTAQLVEWRHAVLRAEVDTSRFLTAAKIRHRLWQKEYADKASMTGLVAASASIETIAYVDEISGICQQLAGTPLPLGVFADPILARPKLRDDAIEAEVKEIPDELAVAFVRFQIDSQPAAETHFLTPNEVHDLEIEVRVSRWPANATLLTLSSISIELDSTYELPVFEFPRPKGDAPFTLRKAGRAILKVAQGLNARPYEFKYTAAFTPDQAEKPAVIGHRTLRIESYDLARNPVTGYPSIDRKIVQVRDSLRNKSAYIPAPDVGSLLLLLKPLCNLSGRTTQDALFRGIASEKAFQDEIRAELRRDSLIGSELEEHARAAGGITDLSFRGIRIELKFSADRPLTRDDCGAFIGQTTAYTVGTGKRIGILCVLDNSQKSSPAFPAEEGIWLHSSPTEEGTVEIVVILLQGGLPIPSALSR